MAFDAEDLPPLVSYPVKTKPRNQGKHGRPTYNQAQKVVSRFGGESALARLIKCSRISIYRWQYRRPYGSDGLIPSAQIEKIKAVARAYGVLIRAEDWVPEVIHYDPLGNVIPSTVKTKATII